MAVVLKFLYLQTAILREQKNDFRESFANPTFILREGLTLKYFAKSFTKKNTSAKSEKNSRGVSCWNPAALAVKNPYVDLWNDSHEVLYNVAHTNIDNIDIQHQEHHLSHNKITSPSVIVRFHLEIFQKSHGHQIHQIHHNPPAFSEPWDISSPGFRSLVRSLRL